MNSELEIEEKVLTNDEKSTSTTITTETVEDANLLEEEEDSFFQDIYLLTEYGIDLQDIEKMREIGLNTVKAIQMTMCEKLLNISQFNVEKVTKIKDACSKIAANGAFITALELDKEKKQIYRITTGSSNLDKLLGGGVESMALTEVFGESRTGKTQIALTLCVTAQIPTGDYPGGKVIFIDTEQTFRPERIRQIAKRFNLEDKSVLENILYARAYTSEHQYDLLKSVRAKFHEEAGVFKLLIVDSIISLFRMDFLESNDWLKRQQRLAEMMSILKKISEEFNIAVFITNQITSNFTKIDSMNEQDAQKPLGGKVLAHALTTRVAIKRLPGSTRLAVMYGSPDLEEQELEFVLTTGGIRDPKIEEN